MAEGLVKSARKIPTKFDNGFEPTFDSDGAPSCLSWKIDDVADWVEFLGFEQYRVRQKSSYLSFSKSFMTGFIACSNHTLKTLVFFTD